MDLEAARSLIRVEIAGLTGRFLERAYSKREVLAFLWIPPGDGRHATLTGRAWLDGRIRTRLQRRDAASPMELIQAVFLGLLSSAAATRLAEWKRSKANRRSLLAHGASMVTDPSHRWMVLLHSGWVAGTGLELMLANRPFLPWLGFPALFLFLASNRIRYWAIRSLSFHWHTEAVNSTGLGIIAKRPHR